MPIGTVTIAWKITKDAAGTVPATGRVRWHLPRILLTDEVIAGLAPTPWAELVAGAGSITIPDPWDALISPQGWSPQVEIDSDAVNTRYAVYVPEGSAGQTLQLHQLSSIPNPTPGDVWAPIHHTHEGGGGGGAVDSVNGETGAVVLDAADVGAAPAARQIIAGTGLTGGGTLAADRTVALNAASITSLSNADTAVQPGALATVATTGAYLDLTGRPSIPDTYDDLSGTVPSSALPVQDRHPDPIDIMYGLVAANGHPLDFRDPSPMGTNGWITAMYVPAGVALTTCWCAVHAAGVIDGGGTNGFAVYDAAGVLLETTVSDNTLFTTGGLRSKALASPIPASPTRRIVYMELRREGYSVEPQFAFLQTANQAAVFDGGWPSGIRKSFVSGGTGHPASINPATHGSSSSGYMPFMGLS